MFRLPCIFQSDKNLTVTQSRKMTDNFILAVPNKNPHHLFLPTGYYKNTILITEIQQDKRW